MNKRNKDEAQMVIDTAQSYGILILSAVPSKGAWQGHACCLGCALSLSWLCKTNAEPHFHFSPFPVKTEILSGGLVKTDTEFCVYYSLVFKTVFCKSKVA